MFCLSVKKIGYFKVLGSINVNKKNNLHNEITLQWEKRLNSKLMSRSTKNVYIVFIQCNPCWSTYRRRGQALLETKKSYSG